MLRVYAGDAHLFRVHGLLRMVTHFCESSDIVVNERDTTFNNGSLGSCIDEERSEVRKVMRFACSVSHRIFERIWHLLAHTWEVCLFENHLYAILAVGSASGDMGLHQ